MKSRLPRHRIVLVGPATLDTVMTGDGAVRNMGSVPTYAGLAFRQHGISLSVLTNIAQSDLIHFGAYAASGIQLVVGQTPSTTHFVNRESPAGRIQKLPAPAAPISHGLEILADSGIGHIAS